MEQSNRMLAKELEVYESICTLSEQMLAVAQKGDWDFIASIDKEREGLIRQVRNMTKESRLGNEESRRKVDLIQRILSADSETKACVQARMKLLQKGFHTERTLLKSYKQKALS